MIYQTYFEIAAVHYDIIILNITTNVKPNSDNSSVTHFNRLF